MGPPSYSDGFTKPVPINPADTTCGDIWEYGYFPMVSGQPLSNWWDNGNSQISFSSKGFIVINNDGNWDLNETLNTGLRGGTYCDVISGDKIDNSCTGKKILVYSDGRAIFHISHTEEDPFIAIHAESKL